MSAVVFTNSSNNHIVRANPVVLTADATLVADTHTDRILTNLGASVDVVWILPSALAGTVINVLLGQNGPQVKLLVSGIDSIFWGDVIVEGASYIYANQIYSSLTLVCVSDTKWVVWGQPAGNWSVGPL